MQLALEEEFVAGVDEAGRGPLAGPVIAAAVILNPKKRIRGLADSKLLSEKERLRLFDEIRKHCLAWSVARGTVNEIDTVNILQATFLAMQRAVRQLHIPPTLALIDGNLCPAFPCAAKSIIKGDQLEPAISAASIIAKVLRDRLMTMLDKRYPHYGFAQHKGYGTEQHLTSLRQHGPSRIHRRSFAPVAALYRSS
ncbi:MAG: ribonuclease HII [Gammaproteobacteria bacterium]|nr:ribonuclease HII [Gammaproteobacteria bacterium]